MQLCTNIIIRVTARLTSEEKAAVLDAIADAPEFINDGIMFETSIASRFAHVDCVDNEERDEAEAWFTEVLG